jgi:hypothetical protein
VAGGADVEHRAGAGEPVMKRHPNCWRRSSWATRWPTARW